LVVTKTGCEVLTRFPAEHLPIAGRRYYSSAGPVAFEREIPSHLNKPADREQDLVVTAD
jgi:Xaa-Pro aminopeptidase